MDEINEKAIKEIMDYYDSLDASEKKPEAEVPKLVDIVEETQKRSDFADDMPKEDESAQDEENLEDKPSEPEQTDGSGETDNEQAETAASEDIPAEEEESEAAAGEAEEAETEKEKSEETPKEKTDRNDGGKNPNEVELAITPVYNLAEPEKEEEETERKPKKRAFAVAAVIIAAVIALFITVDTGFMGTYKKNASKNISWILDKTGIDFSKSSSEDDTAKDEVKKTASRETAAKSSVAVPMETAGKSSFAKYRNGVVCAYTNYLAFISTEGETVWENTTTIINPILKTAGNYILIAENGGKKLCLYNDSRLIYETETEDNILTCNLSSNGDAVIVCDKSAYKGSLAVFNKDGNRIFVWSSGSDNIISADISASSRRVAAALLNTDEKVKTTVQLFDINKTESYAQVIFEDTIIFDVDFSGDTVNLVGDNSIAGLTSNGELLYDKRFDDAEFVHYSADETGNKILLFDNANLPLINIYNSGAELKYQLTSDEIPEFVDICGKYIVYNSGRDIIYGKSGKRQLSKYTASMDIKDLMLLDESTFIIVYSNNIEIVRM